MEQDIKESIYMNPVMETYEVDGQMDIFAFIPREKKEGISFELCMNPPVND